MFEYVHKPGESRRGKATVYAYAVQVNDTRVDDDEDGQPFTLDGATEFASGIDGALVVIRQRRVLRVAT